MKTEIRDGMKIDWDVAVETDATRGWRLRQRARRRKCTRCSIGPKHVAQPGADGASVAIFLTPAGACCGNGVAGGLLVDASRSDTSGRVGFSARELTARL